jgi:hypothetical protein
MSSKEGRERATPRDRCSRGNRNDPRASRFRHRWTREHGAAREHRPKISAMRVDFVRWARDAVLGARFTEFAHHGEIATMTIPTHSSALKRVHRNKTTAASPCDFRLIRGGFTDHWRRLYTRASACSRLRATISNKGARATGPAHGGCPFQKKKTIPASIARFAQNDRAPSANCT